MQLKQRACVGAITLVALCGLPFVASSSANSGKPGSDLAGREHGAPPASKSQCKQYVARRVKILAEVEANFKRDQPKLAAKAAAATKESKDLKAEVQTLTDQANQLTETDTTGYAQEQIDVLNAQVDALMQQRQQDQQKLENTVGPAHSDAEYALRQLVKNHTRDVAGWKGAIKIVKDYCAKNIHESGGEFRRVHGRPRTDLAAVDDVSGKPQPWRPRADAPVEALAVIDDTVYAGGRFTSISDASRQPLSYEDVSGKPYKTHARYAEGAQRSRTDRVSG